MANSSRFSSSAATDLALFGALIAVPALLGVKRGVRVLAAAFTVGKLAASMMTQNSSRPRPQPQQPAAAPPHHAPTHGGLDHIDNTALPVNGSIAIGIIR